ncbi:SEC14-like protein 6 isoform X2 [Homo sapiens]|uniref:SEC14-like protein 6 isoform X2 n=1 Tax=Homo sapiens TaxID=9606 RepID=UPI001FB17D4A|nr:putative SEC14-like protein 6 isoform X2 [Homo sapiens]
MGSMSGQVGDLSPSQEKSLAQFRENIQDVLSALPNPDDYFLLRWLQARSFDLQKSEDMLRKHMEFRKQQDLANILAWQPPEVVRLYNANGICGHDGEGSPVWYHIVGSLDPKGLLLSASKQELLRDSFRSCELLLRECELQSQKVCGCHPGQLQPDTAPSPPEPHTQNLPSWAPGLLGSSWYCGVNAGSERPRTHPRPHSMWLNWESFLPQLAPKPTQSTGPHCPLQPHWTRGTGISAPLDRRGNCNTAIWPPMDRHKELGKRVEKIIAIFGLEGLGLRDLWKPGIELLQEFFSALEANYPEILKSLIVVRAPKLFAVAFNLVKSYMSEETRRKVVILGDNWKQELTKFISPDQLPVEFGGTMTDPDGNPKCLTKINYGGEVPKSYYLCKQVRLQYEHTRSVGRGSSLQVENEILFPGCVLRCPEVLQHLQPGSF